MARFAKSAARAAWQPNRFFSQLVAAFSVAGAAAHRPGQPTSTIGDAPLDENLSRNKFKTAKTKGTVPGCFETISSEDQAPKWVGWCFSAALIAIVFLAYKPCWHGTWLLDDDLLLLDNPVLKPGGLLRIWVPGSYLNYWPLTYSLYWIQFQLWGLHSLGYHLVNIALHVISSLLLWRVLRRLRIPGAWLAAAIFALHPVNAESVAWVAELKGALALALALVSVLFYLDFERDGGRWRYALAVIAFALTALAKGSALTLPLVLLALAWWQRRRIDRRDILRTSPYFVIAAVMSGLEIWSQHFMDSATVRGDGIFSRAAIAGCAIWFYLGKAIWPIDLIPIYPRWPLPASCIAYLPGIALVAIAGAGWQFRQRWGRPLLMVMFCYGVLLLPALGFVNITFMRYSLVADHWQYSAMTILCAAAGAAITILARRFLGAGATVYIAPAILVPLFVLTYSHSCLFADPDSFWGGTIAVDPKSWLAQNDLGTILQFRGDPGAIDHFRKAVAANPNYAEARGCLGAALASRGDFDEAIRQSEKALQIDSSVPGANLNLGTIFANRGEFDLAIAHLKRELEIKPDSKLARQMLASVTQDRKRLADAVSSLREQVQQHPNDVDLLFETSGMLATNPNASVRDGAEAVRLAERAVKITDGNDPRILSTLAAAYGEVGRYHEAVIAAKRAIDLFNMHDQPALADQCRKFLAQFEAGKPVRELHGR